MTRGKLLNRMFEAFGKEVSSARMYYYEEWAKSLPIETVKHIIDNAVKSNDYLPTVSKLYQLTTLADSIDYKQVNVYFCRKCDVGFTEASGTCPTCGERGL